MKIRNLPLFTNILPALPFLMSILVATSLPVIFSDCSGRSIEESTAEELYKDAEEDISDHRYIMALEKLKALKNRFPYSHLATSAQLRIGDVHYLEESFIEAASAYESFRDMHPKHEKADYVVFRIGESYYNQLPGTNDRDLTPATKAIEAYRELVSLYPKSQYLGEATKHLKDSTERLAEKEKYIGDFYFKRDMFDSASGRYEKITRTYPGTPVEEYSYWQWAQSLLKQDRTDETKHVMRVYLSRFPEGKYSKSAKQWLSAHSGEAKQ